MAPLKCCVSGCSSTSNTHKLFCTPMKDSLRNLWMSKLVPTSPYLLLLTQNQFMSKRVCEKHFDETQFDAMGVRIRYSYPCLFTEDEFIHGVPLCSDEYNVLQEHNYYNRDSEDDIESNQIYFVDTSENNDSVYDHSYAHSCEDHYKEASQKVTYLVPLHRFPNPDKYPDLFNAWVSVVGEQLKVTDRKIIYKSKELCDHHFHPSDKMSTDRLKLSTIPSVNLHRIRQGCTTFIQADHCYTRPIRETLHVVPLVYITNLPGPSRPPVVPTKMSLSSGSTETTCVTTDDVSLFRRPPIKFDADNLHTFPNPKTEKERFNAWVQAVGPTLSSLDEHHVLKARRVCHDHFELKYCTWTNRLSNIAVPTLFLRGKPYNELEEVDSRLPEGQTHNDHTYSISTLSTIVLNVPPAPHALGTCPETKRRYIPTIPSDGAIDIGDSQHVNQKDIKLEIPQLLEPVPQSIEDEADVKEDYGVQEALSPVPEVEDSGGKALFSWQKTELIEADEPEEAPAADPTLALYCDSDPDPHDPQPAPDQTVPSEPVPEDVENRCKDCGEVSEGFSWWCVQCLGGALCGACADRPPHRLHYVLRAPTGATKTRTQAVLEIIRQQLQNGNLLSEAVDDGIKTEVKEEPVEKPPAEPDPPGEADPLAGLEPRAPCTSPRPARHTSPRPARYTPRHARHTSPRPVRHTSPRPVRHTSPRPTRHPSPALSTSPARHPYPALSISPALFTSPAPPYTVVADRPGRDPLAEPVMTIDLDCHDPETLAEPRVRTTCTVNENTAEKIADHQEPFKPHRSRTYESIHKQRKQIPMQRKLVQVSPAEVKRVFLSHIERVVTTQKKQENFRGSSQTSRESQIPMKVTSEPTPGMIIDLDNVAAEETEEYLEESLLESDIETIDDHDDDDDDVLDRDYEINPDDLDALSDDESIVEGISGRGVKRKKSVEVMFPTKGPSESTVRALHSKGNNEMNAEYLDDISDNESIVEGISGRGVKRKKCVEVMLPTRRPCESTVRALHSESNNEMNAEYLDDLSDNESVVEGISGRGVKRKKSVEVMLPARGPCDTMARALHSEAVVEVRPLSSLEIRKWMADRKRLRKD